MGVSLVFIKHRIQLRKNPTGGKDTGEGLITWAEELETPVQYKVSCTRFVK
jgi:hypothetical protein